MTLQSFRTNSRWAFGLLLCVSAHALAIPQIDAIRLMDRKGSNTDKQVCGGFAGIPCDQGEFCLLPPGYCCCDFQGWCVPQGEACPAVYNPVCGCDGNTYGNICEAIVAGVNIDHFGPCSRVCPGPGPAWLCTPEEYCKLPVGVCDAPGPVGVCSLPPQGCPDNIDPVCGCDGVAYFNACEADADGVNILHLGACVRHCGANNPATACLPGEYCKLPIGQCVPSNTEGVCSPTGGACPTTIYDPVCGCDGNTYGNPCDAESAGMNVAYLGPCDDECRPTNDGFACENLGCGSPIPEVQCVGTVLSVDWDTGAIRYLDCNCMDFNLCHPEFGNVTPFPVGNCPNNAACTIIAQDINNDGLNDIFRAACQNTP